ncbi:Alpha/Beta hydrolase protein [Aspergillus keveii]|uniref:Alpha/Beta hydrolase protein n=1 Tax=Aspergillus keveii TaxID=714993 RepID=A0ABR4FVC0_9EURO
MMKTYLISLLLGIAPLSAATPAANFNASSEVLAQYGCDAECQAVFTAAQAKDRELVAAYRFQYTSKDLDGSLVPVTGFIAIPYTTLLRDRKYSLIAYAHGTIGVFRGCPPTTTQTLYDYTSWSLLIQRGYAIVATDYAGLGNNHTQHKYLSFPAHANDLYYSVVAARKAFPSLFTDEWMSIGHSQGGGAVWKLSEGKLHSKPSAAGTYIGTVALAPASKIYDMTLLAFSKVATSPNYDEWTVTYELPWLPLAVKRVFPDINFSFLGEKFLSRVALAERTQSCYYSIMSLMYGLTPSDMLSESSPADLTDVQKLREWQDLVAPANGDRSSSPLLIIMGMNDTAVLPETTIASFDDTCGFGNEAHLRLYEGMDHTDVMLASAPEWFGFVDEQFGMPGRARGCPAPARGCTRKTYRPFDAEHMVTEAEVDEMQDLRAGLRC